MVDAGQVWSFACWSVYVQEFGGCADEKMVAVRRRIRLFEKELRRIIKSGE